MPLGRVSRTLDIGNGAAVAGGLPLVALDAPGPTREAASARASLNLAHGLRGSAQLSSDKQGSLIRCASQSFRHGEDVLLERSELSVSPALRSRGVAQRLRSLGNFGDVQAPGLEWGMRGVLMSLRVCRT